MNEPLSLVRGMMCDERLFAPQLEAFAEHRAMQVLLPTGQASIEGIAADLLAQAPEHFALAGVRLGAIGDRHIFMDDGGAIGDRHIFMDEKSVTHVTDCPATVSVARIARIRLICVYEERTLHSTRRVCHTPADPAI